MYSRAFQAGLLLCMAGLLPIPDAGAADSFESPTLINGLIMDETMSKSGHNFYALFHQKWVKNNSDDFINLTIKEQPGQFRGGFILVLMQDEIIFKSTLPLKYDGVEQLAETAIQSINQLLYRKAFVHEQLDHY